MSVDIMAAVAALCALVIWDLGRRFASRGRAVQAEDMDRIEDRLTLAEAEFKNIAALQEQAKLVAEKHNAVARTVAEQGKALTNLAMGRARK